MKMMTTDSKSSSVPLLVKDASSANDRYNEKKRIHSWWYSESATILVAALCIPLALLVFYSVTVDDYSYVLNFFSIPTKVSDTAPTKTLMPPPATTTDAGESDEDDEVVLITGATGRLGSQLYFELREQHNRKVRALVRNVTKAKEILKCERCDESEGIYVGDVTDESIDGGLESATRDGKVTALVIAAAAGMSTPKNMIKAVEFDGVVNSVRAVATHANANRIKQQGSSSSSSSSVLLPKVVLCSSMGTTGLPDPGQGDDFFHSILHWKLNAEAFLSSAGVPSFIVKPCGLDERLDGLNYTMFTGQFDAPSENHGITRSNVARVMTEAVIMPPSQTMATTTTSEDQYRFDLCSKPGTPTTDYRKLIQDSRWEWEK